MGPENRQPSSTSYKTAGVDIDAGNQLVTSIVSLTQSTHRKGVVGELGGFGGIFDLKAIGYKDPLLVASTDGVGTKLAIANEMNKHDTIGIDLVAMCVNDLIVQGAEPLFFLDYFATGALDIVIAHEVIKGIAQGCKQSACALIGGETAEMPGMYKKGDYDLAGFAIGAVERSQVLPRKDLKSGDIILGLSSNGIHSNGFSLVRYLLKEHRIALDTATPWQKNTLLGEYLLTPTRIYVSSLLAAIKTEKIKALAHITGGGLKENIPRVFDTHLSAVIYKNSWSVPPIFSWLQELGRLAEEEMFKTFNMGIGMVIIVAPEDKEEITHLLTQQGEECHIIGEIKDIPGKLVQFV